MAEARNESQLVGQIMKALKEEFPEVWLLKVHGDGYQTAGVPDLLIAVQGYLIPLEVKHRKDSETVEHARERTSKLQKIELRKLRAAGFMADTVISVEETLAIVRNTVAGNPPLPWLLELD